jgi:hypothetical protein
MYVRIVLKYKIYLVFASIAHNLFKRYLNKAYSVHSQVRKNGVQVELRSLVPVAKT